MNPFEFLRQSTEQAQGEAELPDFLAERILRIASDPEGYGHAGEKVAELARQVRDYDTYAQCGYLAMGVNSAILEATLRRVEALRRTRED